MRDDARYPIGTFTMPDTLTEDERVEAIARIADTPSALEQAVDGFDDEQLDTPYREGGWTVRQLVHHVADSHLNSFLRFKLGATEEEPTICLYKQDRWAATPETSLPVDVSLRLLAALHVRWVTLLRSFSSVDWKRKINHPEWGKISLEQLAALYAWHGDHHVAHVRALRQAKGW